MWRAGSLIEKEDNKAIETDKKDESYKIDS